MSARYVLAVILAPSQSFPCWLQYQRELVKEVNIGIEREESVQHLAKEIHITLACKIVPIQRDLNVHAPEHKTLLKTADQGVLYGDYCFKPTAVHFIVGPVIER